MPKHQTDKDLAFIENLFIHKGTEYLLRYLKTSEEAVFNVIFQISLKHSAQTKVSVGLDFKGWPK
jgi:hypothetical protein